MRDYTSSQAFLLSIQGGGDEVGRGGKANSPHVSREGEREREHPWEYVDEKEMESNVFREKKDEGNICQKEEETTTEAPWEMTASGGGREGN